MRVRARSSLAHGDLHARGGRRAGAQARHFVRLLRDGGGSKVGMKKIFENLMLAAAAWLVYRGDRSWLSLGAWNRARRVATAAGIAILSITAALRARRADRHSEDDPRREACAHDSGGAQLRRCRCLPSKRRRVLSLDHRERRAASGVSLRNDSPSRSARAANAGDRGRSVSRK